MSFPIPRNLGLALGAAAIGLLLLIDALLLAVLRGGWLTLGGFISVVLLLASVPVLLVVGYRTYALARARYVLSRNALVVEWGGRRLVVPMAQVVEARSVVDFDSDLLPRGLHWPGNRVGVGVVEPLGPVEFLAAADKPDLVLVRHTGEPVSWLALSPAEPEVFLDNFMAFQAEGPEEDVEAEDVRPAFEGWALWRDRLALGLLAAGLASVVLLFGYLALIAPQLPEQIALHFNAQGQPDRFGPPAGLLILPVIAGLAWLVNALLGVWFHRGPRERPAAYLLLGATLFVQALVWVAAVGLLTAGNAA
jgi:hypothetical protein